MFVLPVEPKPRRLKKKNPHTHTVIIWPLCTFSISRPPVSMNNEWNVLHTVVSAVELSFAALWKYLSITLTAQGCLLCQKCESAVFFFPFLCAQVHCYLPSHEGSDRVHGVQSKADHSGSLDLHLRLLHAVALSRGHSGQKINVNRYLFKLFWNFMLEIRTL